MDLKDKVKSLPTTPGVYLMKDSLNSIIYVGKAKNLKRRVQSYFRQSKGRSQKVEKLIKHLKDFDYILTDTEFEAFLLECQLIQEIKPLYNKKMKSPQSYVYIVIRQDEGYRKMEISSLPTGGLSFGPFTSKSVAEKAVQGIKECFRIDCSSPANKHSYCLNYSLGLCIGMCKGGTALEEYNRIIDQFIALLKRTDRSLLEEIERMMIQASNQFDFEAAAKYRNHLEAVGSLLEKEKVIEFAEENKNVVIAEGLSSKQIKLFLVKGNKVLFSEKIHFDSGSPEPLTAKIKNLIFTYFKNSSVPVFREMSSDEIDQAQIIYNYLKSSNCSFISIPDKWLTQEEDAKIDVEINQLLCGDLSPATLKR